MDKKIPIYEAKILGTDNTGIFAMSFVDFPANERNFVALNKMKAVKLKLDKQKHVLTGAVLIPDQLIYRNERNLGEYYLKFTAADIEKIADKMMRTGIALSTTTHQHEKPLKGNYLTELWIVADPKKDKSVTLGLGEYPAGTLVASYKINDPAYWRTEVLAGKVKGFSIEGLFNFNSVKMTTAKKPTTPAAKKTGSVLSFLKSVTAMLEGDTAAEADALADVAKTDEVGAGDPFLIFELADGSEVYVDQEGYATLDDEQAPAGDHALADGNFLVIDDSGMMVVTAAEADAADPAKAADPVAMKKKTDAAKARAKALLTKQPDPNAAKIAKLEKELAALKKEPSTEKAKPTVPGTEKAPADMSYTEKMAAVIKSRRDRQESKRKPAAQ